MRVDQLALRLENNEKWRQLWVVLPPDSRKTVTRALARLCVRAARVTTPVVEQEGRTDHAT